MCDAVTMGLVVQGTGKLMQGVSAAQRGNAARAADYQSGDAAERAAADATQRGELRELQTVMHGSAVVAAQRVAQSGGGADVNVGGPQAAQRASEAVIEIDRAVVRRNAALEAYGLRERARGFRQQGEYAATEGNNAMLGTFLGGVGQIAGEGGRIAADVAGGPVDHTAAALADAHGDGATAADMDFDRTVKRPKPGSRLSGYWETE